MKILIGPTPPPPAATRIDRGTGPGSPLRIVVLKQTPEFLEILERILKTERANGAQR